MRKYLLLALLGLAITGCSKNAPVTPITPTPPVAPPTPTAPGYDFRNATYGETLTAVEATESTKGNAPLGTQAGPSGQGTSIMYQNSDGSADVYMFDATNKCNGAGHITINYTNTAQMAANFQSYVSIYTKLYGNGLLDVTAMTDMWVTKRSAVELRESDDTPVSLGYRFFIIYVPADPSEVSLVRRSHLIQVLQKAHRSL